ncbi:hypothetical protein ACFW1F_21205 [Streptomyces bungoensis]|uniref:hypothetical protein n=1 Tax=Streptomyces bungoensis TaxID=285568 RepID=UPI003414444B
MPRGRHRHSPPLHRLLPPSVIAGVSVVCALGPWVFSSAALVRALAAAAAVTAVLGAVVMRRWDAQAGKQVADLTRARASDEWRYEERVAELETDLEESRELRTKLEQRLRAKRAELAGLRNEHAALLRRYATAETERASALEGRRLLEIEAAEPSTSLALPPARKAEPETEEPEAPEDAGDEPAQYAVFSPEGSRLFLRAGAALARLDPEAPAEPEAAAPEPVPSAPVTPEPVTSEATEPAKGAGAGSGADEGAREGVTAAAEAAGDEGAAQEDEAEGQPGAAGGHARAAAAPTAPAEPAASQGPRRDGHFTVPTAVAVVPAAPVRRPVVEGGFDFFGTQKHTSSTALESVQNEDLADVVGQEALALHKAETEGRYKPADAGSRGVGQVIDLTAHDETEQIDVQRLRTAAS